MTKTISELHTLSKQIQTANEGENTRERVGGLFEDIVDYLEDNPGGGGSVSLNQPLSAINNAGLGNPNNGQTLIYSNGRWTYGTPGGGGGGGTGTLSSVGLNMPTGFSVVNSPLTSNGSIIVSFTSGYSLLSTTLKDNWNAAADKINTTTWWGHTIQNNAVTGNLSGNIGYIEFSNGVRLGIDGTNTLKIYNQSGTEAHLYTTGALSALGSSSGGGTVTQYLRDLLDVEINNSSLANGNALLWDSSKSKWVNGVVSGGGGVTLGVLLTSLNTMNNPSSSQSGYGLIWNGTNWEFGQYSGGGSTTGGVTSVTIAPGTGLSVLNPTVTSSGTITIGIDSDYKLPTKTEWSSKQDSIADLATIRDKAASAYGWGDHSAAGYLTSQSLSGYATETFVQNVQTSIRSWAEDTFLTSSSIYDMATKTWVNQQGFIKSHQAVNGTFWGQTWSNGNNVSGSLYSVGNIFGTQGVLTAFSKIEFIPSSNSNVGGSLIFHYNGSQSSTSTLEEDASGRLSLYGSGKVGLRIGSSNGDYIKIGGGTIEWDSTNNAFKLTGGLYTDSFLTALGIASSSSVYSISGDRRFTDKVYLGSSSVYISSATENQTDDTLLISADYIQFGNSAYRSFIQSDDSGLIIRSGALDMELDSNNITFNGTVYFADNAVFDEGNLSGIENLSANYVQASNQYRIGDTSHYLHKNGNDLYWYNGSSDIKLS